MRQLFWGLTVLFFLSCNTGQQVTKTPSKKPSVKIPEPKIYRAAYTRKNDLVHTKLEVRPDFSKKQLFGKATITLHPHFHATDSLELNARGMDIHEVSLVKKGSDQNTSGNTEKLSYSYDSLKIFIKLDKVYRSDENYSVFIEYTSKPERLRKGGSAAIREDKGLYFINADLSNPEKPRQVWTQGETESNSAWFPTIEDPQQKMTQEIYITTDTSMTTVSNGLLITSDVHGDGTRTDYWKQSLPAAPYLTMIAVSDFAVVKDKWRNIEVSYYLDKEYEKYVKMIFGHTPEMMEFFSNKLGIAYPWEKYAQIVVHDYVSGAMENNTAVIHGTNMLQDSGDYADTDYEDYISHELFHHWFGNLVTCESWSNMTLNEGFANYSEYLWREYKFGRDDADHLNQGDQGIYLLTARNQDPDVIRFDYDAAEEMYDAISYHKSGRILHMLRKYVGDEAFFESLKQYLVTNQFGAVEIHDLRLAFEKVTGEDLNWFFNQWYFNRGYPVVEINYQWNDTTKLQTVIIEQTQDFTKNPLYRIPLLIDIYHDVKVDRKNVIIEKAREVFSWAFNSKPDLVNVDAERMLLCEKKDRKPKENYIFQYYHAPLYMDRYEALNKTGSEYEAGSPYGQMMADALHDKYWNIRIQALKNIGEQVKANKDSLKPILVALAERDSNSDVRAQASKTLNKHYKDDDQVNQVLERQLNDISYHVQATAFKILSDNDKEKGLQFAAKMESSKGGATLNAIAKFYSENYMDESNDFFISALDRLRGYERAMVADNYGKYLKNAGEKTRSNGIGKLEVVARRSRGYSKNAIVNTLEDLANDLSTKIKAAQSRADELRKNNSGKNEIELVELEAERLSKQTDVLKEKIKRLQQVDSGPAPE